MLFLDISFGFKLPDNEAKINHACALSDGFYIIWVFVATSKGIYYFLGGEIGQSNIAYHFQDNKNEKVQISKIDLLGNHFFYSVESLKGNNIAVSKLGFIQIYNVQDNLILKEIDTNGQWSILQQMTVFVLIKTQSKLMLMHFASFETIDLAKSIHIGDYPSQSLMSIAQENMGEPLRILDIQLKRDRFDPNSYISSIRELNFSVKLMKDIHKIIQNVHY
ncbi:UNKNOWN [Stylonychia lemnae]|uniref:Uncharacterized protein n=1 Tax=Stylonychia lemnae TaxID=5949 RepID=A0A078B860_STYLE|nr:UNKNOWN [Stylonychia lemnae]|eukprot:CDW90705.1 UNKNOWN [Stylonychia lemnae]